MKNSKKKEEENKILYINTIFKKLEKFTHSKIKYNFNFENQKSLKK